MRAVVSFCNNIFLSFLKQNFSIINKILYMGYKRHCAILLFLIFDILDTQIKSFPRKKSVATMFVSFHHSSWNLTVRFRLTESAICRSPPDRLKKISNGNGVNSAITAHNGFWLFLRFFDPKISSSKYSNKPSTVCWLPHTCVKGGHSQSYSKLKRIK